MHREDDIRRRTLQSLAVFHRGGGYIQQHRTEHVQSWPALREGFCVLVFYGQGGLITIFLSQGFCLPEGGHPLSNMAENNTALQESKASRSI